MSRQFATIYDNYEIFYAVPFLPSPSSRPLLDLAGSRDSRDSRDPFSEETTLFGQETKPNAHKHFGRDGVRDKLQRTVSGTKWDPFPGLTSDSGRSNIAQNCREVTGTIPLLSVAPLPRAVTELSTKRLGNVSGLNFSRGVFGV